MISAGGPAAQMMLPLEHVYLMMNMSSMLMALLRTSWEAKLGSKPGRQAFQLKVVAHLLLRTTDLMLQLGQSMRLTKQLQLKAMAHS